MKYNEEGQTTAGAIGITVLCLAVLGAILWGGYLFGWWLQTDVANRNAHLIRHGYEVQQDYRDQLVNDLSDLATVDRQLADPKISAQEKVAITAQRVGMVRQFCLHGSKIVSWSDIDPDVQSAYQRECNPTFGGN